MGTGFLCWWKLVYSLALCLHNMLTSVTFNIKAFYFAQMPSCYIFDRMWKKNSIKNILSLRLYLNMMKRYACNCFSNELSFIIFCFHLMQCYRQANIWFTIWLNVQRSQLKCKKNITKSIASHKYYWNYIKSSISYSFRSKRIKRNFLWNFWKLIQISNW